MLPTKHNQPFNLIPKPVKRRITVTPASQSRRSVLTRMAALIAIGAAGATLPSFGARAAKKSSQKLVKYRDTPKGKRNCSGCTFYLADERLAKLSKGRSIPMAGACAGQRNGVNAGRNFPSSDGGNYTHTVVNRREAHCRV